MKRLVAVLVAIAGAIAVVLAIWPKSEAPTIGSPADDPAAQAPVTPRDATVRSGREPPEMARRELDTPAPARGRRESEPGIPLRGTVVVVDADGTDHGREDGALTVLFVDDRGGFGRDVNVTAGHWSVDVPVGRDLKIGGLELGGREAVLDGVPDRYRVEPGTQIALRARWLRATQLHVVDADTRRELDGVTLVRALDWPRSDLAHPGEVTTARVELRDATSPIELPGDAARSRTFHVGAPGHAWARVQLQPGAGGDRFVELEAGGDLEVGLGGDVANPGLVLRLRDGLVLAEFDVAGRRNLTVDGLPARELYVAAEIGDWWDDHHVLAAGTVTIVPGGRARIDLDLTDITTPELVPFGGEVVLPASWELERFGLIVELLDAPLHGQDEIVRIWSHALTQHDPDTWRWHLDAVQPGRYELELWPLYTSVTLEVGPQGREDVRFEVPPPGEVLVRVIDATTGRLAAVDAVHWHAKWPEWVRGGGLARAERDPDTGLWRIRAPQTDVVISTGGGAYASTGVEVRVTGLPQEVTVQVEPATRAILILRDGDTPVPWPRGADVQLQATEWEKPRPAWVSGGARVWLPVRGPGTYRVRVGRLPGYEPVPEFELVLRDAGTVEHVVRLVRTR